MALKDCMRCIVNRNSDKLLTPSDSNAGQFPHEIIVLGNLLVELNSKSNAKIASGVTHLELQAVRALFGIIPSGTYSSNTIVIWTNKKPLVVGEALGRNLNLFCDDRLSRRLVAFGDYLPDEFVGARKLRMTTCGRRNTQKI